ncbi:ATP-binding protein [Streptomyces sp. SCUT-3]|uniref:ATP-binding protein n=1 Tax=Streptomyces sp. SCUT-3 TaxID=2684469 RepID=UPI000CA6E76A|nr:ATP-binding protein [Streptomyces sp. SCUT-3]PLW72997.1 ATP-binding protein [Streptomyces sp. DJ]QMV24170.1 ATP-binding protein [Streptomyces sp. SCUT-3]
MKYDLAPPKAVGMVASLSSLGYSLPDAVADLVDNSVSAGASTIDVEFTWEGPESWAAIIDDGRGMSEDGLVTAMTVAARWSAKDRTKRDLGRYGVGLKSASFSQCRLLTVCTAEKEGPWTTRTWDLDVVEETGEWRLLREPPAEAGAVLERLTRNRRHGTVVLWQRLNGYLQVSAGDKKTQQGFYDEIPKVSNHLGLVFARFLTGSAALTLRVAGESVQPWDPFLSSHPSVRRLPDEKLPLDGHWVKVRPYVLPGLQRLTQDEAEGSGGPKGWLRQQGFYVYRRDRLILAGSWLGIRGLRREEKYNLARIAIDIPAETDSQWQVDVRKAAVVPPVPLRRHLARIARSARTEAAATVKHKGRISARQRSGDLQFAWKVSRDNNTVNCRINRNHPLVQAVLQSGGNEPADVRALLRLLEETVPVSALRVLHEPDTADDPEPFGGTVKATPEAVEVAQRMLDIFLSQGRSRSDALQVIRTTQPFDQLEGFWTA